VILTSGHPQASTLVKNKCPYSDLAQDMVLIGITDIEDSLRPGVCGARAMSQGRSCRQNVHWRQCPYCEVYRHTVRHLHRRRYYDGGTCIPATERARATGNSPPSSGVLTTDHPVSGAALTLILVGSRALIPRRQKILVFTLKAKGKVIGTTSGGSRKLRISYLWTTTSRQSLAQSCRATASMTL